MTWLGRLDLRSVFSKLLSSKVVAPSTGMGSSLRRLPSTPSLQQHMMWKHDLTPKSPKNLSPPPFHIIVNTNTIKPWMPPMATTPSKHLTSNYRAVGRALAITPRAHQPSRHVCIGHLTYHARINHLTTRAYAISPCAH